MHFVSIKTFFFYSGRCQDNLRGCTCQDNYRGFTVDRLRRYTNSLGGVKSL